MKPPRSCANKEDGCRIIPNVKRTFCMSGDKMEMGMWLTSKIRPGATIRVTTSVRDLPLFHGELATEINQ